MTVAPGDQITASERIATRLDTAIDVFSLLFWGYVIWYAVSRQISQPRYGVLFLGGVLVLYTLTEIQDKVAAADFDLDLVALLGCLAVGTVVTLYVWSNHEALRTAFGRYSTFEYAMGLLLLLTVLYLTYHAFGILFSSVVLVVVLYGLYGNLFPAWLEHAGLGWQRVLEVTAMQPVRGIYGSLNQVVAVMIAPFLLFAGLVHGFGTFEVAYQLTTKVTDYIRSGVAQTAVIMSMIMGMLSGSSVANTALTGSFTIPLMTESGIRPRKAAAIEASASTGGQILPPVMGSAAFVMADLAGVPLVTVLAAATLPALIFYISIFVSVDTIARSELRNVPTEEVQDIDAADVFDDSVAGHEQSTPTVQPSDLGAVSLLLKSAVIVVPLVFLIYMLGVRRDTVMISAVYTCGVTLLAGVVYTVYENLTREFSADSLEDSLLTGATMVREGSRYGAATLAPIAIIIATVGVAVEILLVTGLPTMLAFQLISLSGGVLILFLVITMVIAIILGMGMPTPAAYVIAAIILTPTMIEFGIPNLASHFFILYFAVLSVLTPPIALGSVVASQIAEANFWETCLDSLKIMFPIFLLPFAFVYSPSLVEGTYTTSVLASVAVILVGAAVLSYGLNKEALHLDALTRESRRANVALLIAFKLVVGLVGAGIMIHPFVLQFVT